MTLVKLAAVSLILALPMLAPAAPAHAQTETVNCNAGGSIGQALTRRFFGRALVLNIRGVCVENVVIASDDVTIRGLTLADTIRPADPERATVRIEGGRRVLLDRLTVEGGEGAVVGVRGASFDVRRARIVGGTRFGVVASFGASGAVHDSLVREVAGHGIVAANGGAIAVTDSRVVDNTAHGILGFQNGVVRVGQDLDGTAAAAPVAVRRNGEIGVVVTDSSSLILVGSVVEQNTQQGVVIARTSSARIGVGANGLVSASLIRLNGDDGLSVFQSSQALISGGSVTGNGGSGINVVGTSAATVVGALLSGNGEQGVSVTENSTARVGVNDAFTNIGPVTIEENTGDGIGVFTGSSAVVVASFIRANGGHGINVSHAALRTLGSNLIELNEMHGVSLNASASLVQVFPPFDVPTTRDRILNNTRTGVSAFNGSTLDYRSATISGNGEHGMSLSLKSSGVLSGTTIDANLGPDEIGDGIRLSRASSLVFRSPADVSITGHAGFGIQCFDDETSFEGDRSGIVGNEVQDNCTDFDIFD